MKLKIVISDTDGIAFLQLAGELVAGEEEGAFRDAISQCIAKGRSNVVCDMAGLNQLDGAGMSALALCNTELKRAGGVLKLLNIRPDHLYLMAVAKLETAFEVFTDRQAAVDSFFPERTRYHESILQFVDDLKKDKTAARVADIPTPR